MTIPKGKIISIRVNDSDIFSDAGIEIAPQITIDTEITINLQSKFDSLLGSGANKVLGVFSGAMYSLTEKSFTGQFKEMGYRYWTGTEPVTFSFDTTLYMKTSARKDVFEPAKVLMKLPLPMLAKKGEGFGLIAPGPSVLDALNIDTKFGRMYSFRCGVFYLPAVVFEKAEPTWSSEVDEEGYPIWCKLQMEISSLYTANTNMIDKFGFGAGA